MTAGQLLPNDFHHWLESTSSTQSMGLVLQTGVERSPDLNANLFEMRLDGKVLIFVWRARCSCTTPPLMGPVIDHARANFVRAVCREPVLHRRQTATASYLKTRGARSLATACRCRNQRQAHVIITLAFCDTSDDARKKGHAWSSSFPFKPTQTVHSWRVCIACMLRVYFTSGPEVTRRYRVNWRGNGVWVALVTRRITN